MPNGKEGMPTMPQETSPETDEQLGPERKLHIAYREISGLHVEVQSLLNKLDEKEKELWDLHSGGDTAYKTSDDIKRKLGSHKRLAEKFQTKASELADKLKGK